MIKLAPNPPGRWRFAVRASAAMGAPLLAGVLAGRPDEGLLAMLGAFTVLYGGSRPYAYRALMLAIVAAGFAISVALGVEAAGSHVTAILAVSAIAMATTFLCRVMETGPPGAYLFVLACAIGTAMPASASPVPVALLVLAGGAVAWIAHMVMAPFDRRGPEKLVMLRAARAIGIFVRADASRRDTARHAAALAMHEAWSALVTYQPFSGRGSESVARLRVLGRELHGIFGEAVRAEASRAEGLVASLRAVADRIRHVESHDVALHGSTPLGRFGASEALRESLRPGSATLLVVARVGLASTAAGLVATLGGLEHVYWSIASAVLVLHYGYEWRRTVQRGVERLAGTWVGLLLAAAVLAMHPKGLGLVATVVALQFVIEMLVIRNYAVAVVPITAIALLMAAAGHANVDIPELLLARGVDTTLGCVVGIVVFALTSPRTALRLRAEMDRTREAIEPVLVQLERGTVTTVEAREARRALQHRLFLLAEAYEAGTGGTPGERAQAERSWPEVAAVQRLAYEVLAACWGVERGDAPSAEEIGRLSTERSALLSSLRGK